MEKYIIGTISSKDVPLSTALKADAADTMYFNKTTQEDLQKERDEILGTTNDSLRKTADMIREAMDKTCSASSGARKQ